MFFLEVPFLTFSALHTKKKCGQIGPTLCYSESNVVPACQSFRPSIGKKRAKRKEEKKNKGQKKKRIKK